MTVSELVNILKEIDPNTEVVVKGDGELNYVVESDQIYGYVGDKIVLCAN